MSKNFNLYTLCVFEETPYIENGDKYLTNNLIKIDKNYKFGIKRYFLSLEEIKQKFNSLKDENKWFSNNSSENLAYSSLKFIPKQFIPSNNSRINVVLKNNFHSGSYILELFDEDKIHFDFFMTKEEIKLGLFEKIKEHIPINLSTVSDRIGNFIFQFPVTLLEIKSEALSTSNGIDFDFFWNSKVQSKPNCIFQIESKLDDNYMNHVIEEYNGEHNQKIMVDNFQEGTVQTAKFSRKKHNLLLTINDGWLEEIHVNFSLNVGHPEQRMFKIDDVDVKIDLKQVGEHSVLSNKKNTNSKKRYYEHISHKKGDIEKEKLETTLDFKEYFGNKSITDLQRLIKGNDENGVYLWDPFLSPVDILNTLFYSEHFGVELRALGSPNRDKIQEYKDFFDNILESNKKGLNLEFRARNGFGRPFHDRFLIFPGNIKRLEKPKVYSLGTSINSYCNENPNYYILQKVSYPQPIIDAFNNLWSVLNKEECLIWKYPK
ncbi:MAG: VPA1262 family N-terminal domain-containing protein [Methanobrevibacter sp.]|nr:VPA1262 family N-terminal domain-containing protein [Methanobrevibacter sp.]